MVLDISDKTLSVDFFSSKIQTIISNNHKIDAKKKMIIYPKRINFACPYCGDSEKVASKKRGNLWLNSMMYTCFNCGTKSSFPKFCDDFKVSIEIEDRIKIYNIIDSKAFSNEDIAISSLSKLIDIDDWMHHMNNRSDSWLTSISPVVKGSQIYQYLVVDRNITNHENIFQGVYRKFRDGKCTWQGPVMINVNRKGNKLLGIQLRNLDTDRNKRFYKIIEFSELYNYMNPANMMDDIESISYNKLSHFYNILNINFDEKITIFEGFLDSVLWYGGKNSIGMVGSNNGDDLVKFLTETDESLKLQFFYDNDEAGNRCAVKMLDKGYSVFLWKKLFEDIINKSENRIRTEQMLKNVVDLNDLVLLYKNENICQKLNLDKYFSIDRFDKIYLEKVQKYKF